MLGYQQTDSKTDDLAPISLCITTAVELIQSNRIKSRHELESVILLVISAVQLKSSIRAINVAVEHENYTQSLHAEIVQSLPPLSACLNAITSQSCRRYDILKNRIRNEIQILIHSIWSVRQYGEQNLSLSLELENLLDSTLGVEKRKIGEIQTHICDHVEFFLSLGGDLLFSPFSDNFATIESHPHIPPMDHAPSLSKRYKHDSQFEDYNDTHETLTKKRHRKTTAETEDKQSSYSSPSSSEIDVIKFAQSRDEHNHNLLDV